MQKNNRYFPILLCVSMGSLTACSLPPNQAKKEAASSYHTEHWVQRQNVDTQIQQGLTAYLALDDAFMSIASRIHLIREARHTLDLQYYIWEDDSLGHMMLTELLKAADRGVKVRLMIDDQNGTKLDPVLKKLAAHPNFEIKLYNPYKYRNFRVLDYALRMKQINHRMHNKLIIADGAIAVTGGRNISREYFDAGDEFQFTDMDILFFGNAVKSANQIFINFWNNDLSYSVPQLLGNATAAELDELRQSKAMSDMQKDQFKDQLELSRQQIMTQLNEQNIEWVKAQFLGDFPEKTLGNISQDKLLYTQLKHAMGTPEQHLELVSAYFVPTKDGTAFLNDLSKQKIQVRVLTNSFLANDVALVHAFYQKYRKDLLENGVQLYEFKPDITRKQRTWYEVLTGNAIPAKGKSSSRLHAKFFDVDGKVFIGSFNFDPRSVHLNTEVGLVVESDQLQNRVTHALDRYLPKIAYELKLNSKGEIIWLEHHENGQVTEYDVDPHTTKFQRFTFKSLAYLPVEWMM